ncbi:MAG: pyridoxal phosphate-dependent aminotransferase [Rhizobiaceae bacterium]
MADRPRLTPLVDSLPETVPFVGPETQERTFGRPFAARIGANENGFGPSPAAISAMADAAPDMWKYCDPENFELREALAAHLDVGAGNITIGEGIDGLLGLTVRQYVSEGAPVITSLGAYPTFNYHVAGFGGRLVTVPYAGDREDPEALLAAARRERAPLVYFANPDNPMGTWWPADEVQRLVEALPETTMLVLDEAYGEFAPEGTLPPLDVSRPNVLRFRTFSKAYGLAGLRCGYCIGEGATIRAFDRVRNHFGVSRMAQAACLAALGDSAWLAKTIADVDAARRRIAGIATANGLAALPSATNFVAIDCGGDGAHALDIMNRLIAAGIFVRKPAAPGLDRCIRVSCGPEADMAAFETAFGEALAAG